MTKTYVIELGVTLGDEQFFVAEVGPFDTIEAARTAADAALGNTPKSLPDAELLCATGSTAEGSPITGYTMVRYDGEQTDPDFFINGPMTVMPIPQSVEDPYGEQLTCGCGNTSHTDGFYASDADGTDQIDDGGGPLDTWDGVHYKCARCDQVWSQVPASNFTNGE